ncbi:hypothetical protein [Halalkalicoccus subterraneus]|uniref:hypothetical protein n=1 Tax=Halalkalicoccus subterraneus TaxID=2675002 RepID=UPI000EFD8F87|nr:hypothetical protein [Halalkalicoccus subterraneus]
MVLTRSMIEEAAADYIEEEPLYPVEEEGIGTLPSAFAEGEFGFRDAEWVVQWYYRRNLGAYPQDRQRAREDRFAENERSTTREAVIDAANAEALDERVGRLTELAGVDTRVASAFLQFIDPDRYVAVDARTWTVLYDAGELDEPYPDSPSVEEYRRFLDACRAIADEHGVDCWTLYRALWRLGHEN